MNATFELHFNRTSTVEPLEGGVLSQLDDINAFSDSSAAFNASTRGNEAAVDFLTSFPNHMMLDIWVEAHNRLGRVESEHLKEEAGWFGKWASCGLRLVHVWSWSLVLVSVWSMT